MELLNLISLHSFVVLVGLMIYVLVSHTLRQRRNPSAAVAWVITLALVPYIGLPLYLIFGTRKLVRAKAGAPRAVRADGQDSEENWPRHLAAAMNLAPPASFSDLRIHEDGREALHALHEQIDSAKRTLDICTFILGRDAVADEICEKLAVKAREGVKVRLMVDGAGNLLEGRGDLGALRAKGVEVVTFVPPLHSPRRGRFNLRNHRKMVIADGAWLWCGGRKPPRPYSEGAPGVTPWKDLTFDLKGDLAVRASECFENDWAFAADKSRSHVARYEEAGAPRGQLFPSGPEQADDTIYSLLATAFFKAHARIAIVTPYFVPDPTLLMGLTLAARRGVQVDVVLPAKSNHRMADLVRPRALRDLAGAGARVSLVPHMIHAKAVVVDDTLALAGSANLDARSLFLNFEMMVAFYDRDDVRRFAGWIDREMAGATRYVAHAPGLFRDLTEGLVLWLAFQL